MSYRRSEEFAKETSIAARLLRGLARRMAVTLTDGVLWQVLGQRGGQGGDETIDVEPFTGIGFYSKPSSSGNPEAITAAIGGHKTTVIVATRDEATRKTGAGDLAADETCVYNGSARVFVKANGTVEIRLHGGAAATEPTIKGTTYRSAENTLISSIASDLAALSTAIAALAAASPTLTGTAPQIVAWTAAVTAAATAAAALVAAVAAFNAGASTYVSTVAKVQ